MHIKQSILTCIIFVLVHLSCYGMSSSVEQIISDEQLSKLLSYNIKDIPYDQKYIAQEFEIFEKKSSAVQKFRSEFEKKFNISYLVKAMTKKVKMKEHDPMLDMLVDKLGDVVDEEGWYVSRDNKSRFIVLLSSVIGYPVFPLAKSDVPALHKKVEQLSIKFQIPKPLIFVCFNDSCVGMYVNSDGKKESSANLIIGYKTLINCDDVSLDVLLAHELGHVKLNHLVPLRILLRMGTVGISSYFFSYFISNWVSKMIGYDDWTVKAPLFLSSSYIISRILNKIFPKLCGWHYFDCRREIEADQEALNLFGPEAFIRSFQQIGYLYDKQLKEVYAEGVLSENRLKEALIDGFTQEEQSKSLCRSMMSLNNYDHPTIYQRIVFAARMWAKKYTADSV
jgi:hypothetical protein